MGVLNSRRTLQNLAIGRFSSSFSAPFLPTASRIVSVQDFLGL